MQETQVYANVIDAIVCNSIGYNFAIPAGTFRGLDILKKIWFKIQKEKENEDPTVIMQRAMWLSNCRFYGDSLQTVDQAGKWYDTGMYLVKK